VSGTTYSTVGRGHTWPAPHVERSKEYGILTLRNSSSDGRQRHLLVAGTGRAGTSALVRYLTGLGLETHLSRNGGASTFDDEAGAGLEDLALPSAVQDLPYVVKSPWSYQIIEEVLDDPRIALDAVVVPIRDLVSAATSRTVREMQAIHQAASWMAETSAVWEHWGVTPGGMVFSLNPVDQARLLALAFHQLIERLVRADVPVLFLAFPRFATDPDYLYRRIAPLLPVAVNIAQAREVHAATFEASKIRVEREFSDAEEPTSFSQEATYPTFQALDNAALRREMKRLRGELKDAHARGTAVIEEMAVLRDEIEARKVLAADAETERIAREKAHVELRGQLKCRAIAAEAINATLEARSAALEASCAALTDELAALQDQIQSERKDKSLLLREMLALRSSRSWRMTHPLRVVVAGIRRIVTARSLRRAASPGRACRASEPDLHADIQALRIEAGGVEELRRTCRADGR
jgi:hypothetical protein